MEITLKEKNDRWTHFIASLVIPLVHNLPFLQVCHILIGPSMQPSLLMHISTISSLHLREKKND